METRSDAVRTPATIAGVLFLSTLMGCVSDDSNGVDGGTRWQPSTDTTIVFTFEGNSDGAPSLYKLRRELSANKTDPFTASRFTTTALNRYAQSGDPRMLGYADGALNAWSDAANPPLAIWLLRGRLTQTEHRFEAAARDMDSLLAIHRGNAEALLLAADAWRRAGNVAAARGRCLALSLSGHNALGQLCAADIQMSLGNPEQALQTSTKTIAGYGDGLPGETLAWAHSIRAEAATASGALEEAMASWQAALEAVAKPTLAMRLGQVDTLLEARRYRLAMDELDDLPEADAVLLRRAIAGKALGDKNLEEWRNELQQRFTDPAYASEESLHWRERSLFELDVMQNSGAALDYAQRNWAVQKGFEDAQLLLRAANAAGSEDAAQAVISWRAEQSGSG